MLLNSLYLDCESTSTTQRPALYTPNITGKQGKIITTLYTPNSNGPHPVLIFVHGFPGHEKNIDLAQAMRRIGFNVIVYFHSGSWGSEGSYSFSNSIDDTNTVLDFVLSDKDFNFDKSNIFFLGHSLGCFAAAKVITMRSEVKGGIFLMPCDLGMLYNLGKVEKTIHEYLISALEEGAQFLNGTDRFKLIKEIEEAPDYYLFDSMIAKLSDTPILWISSKNDELVPEAIHTIPFMNKLCEYPKNKIAWRSLNTDHYFSDIRIQSSYEIARFLNSIIDFHSISGVEQAAFIDELKKLLAKEYKTLTLSEAAAHFNISVPYLSRLIHEKTGKNFTAILTELKMEKAKELLLDTQLTIYEVAECLGYNNPPYFMRCFKRHFDYTPTKYRKIKGSTGLKI